MVSGIRYKIMAFKIMNMWYQSKSINGLFIHLSDLKIAKQNNSMMCIFYSQQWLLFDVHSLWMLNIMDTMKSIFEWFVMYVSICDIDLLWFFLSIQMSDFVVKNE